MKGVDRPGDGHRDASTIVAPATAPGRGALAIVRLGGPETRAILSSCFRPSHSGPLRAREARLGEVVDRSGRLLDQAVVVFWEGPASCTGEDLAEVTVHGSPPVVRELVATLVAAGARRAYPGEFTLRAVRHGKLDLTRAEAIRDLVDAATVEQAHVAARQLRGEVAQEIGGLAARLLDLLADVEAGLDFSEDEDLGPSGIEIASRCREIVAEIGQILEASELGRRIREGARVVLTGPPNAGKSALFNRLVGSDRVIVTPEPGTTRDTIEETVVLEGLPVVLVDGAGVREAENAAERAGVERARAAARLADLVRDVYPLHRTERPQPDDDPRRLPVGTHAALPRPAPPIPGSCVVSSVTGEGLDSLRAEIARRLDAPGDRPIESVALATDRHREAAARAGQILERLARRVEEGLPAALAAVDLRQAVASMREILGEVSPDDLLGRIFSRFCIGQ